MNVARQLQTSAPNSEHAEAFYRSAIGRAYYACFLTCRVTFFPPHKWGRWDATHQKVRNVVKKKLPGSASGLFDTLRQLREHSDYHTWPAAGTTHEEAPPRCECQWNPSTDENCMYALGLASELLRQLAKQREF